MGNKGSKKDENYEIMVCIEYIISKYYSNYSVRIKNHEDHRFMSSIPKSNTIYISGNTKKHDISIYRYNEEKRRVENILKMRIDYEERELYVNNIGSMMNPECVMYMIEFGKSETVELDFEELEKDKVEKYINMMIKYMDTDKIKFSKKIRILKINKYLVLSEELKENKTIKKVYFNKVMREYKKETLKLVDFENIRYKKDIFIEYY